METQLRVIAFLAVIGFCASIKCYTCGYDRTTEAGMKNCNDPFVSTNVTTMECGGQCQKKKIFRDTDKRDEFQLYRSCVNDCESSQRNEIYCCNEDLCNAASPSAIYSFTFLLSSTVVAYLV